MLRSRLAWFAKGLPNATQFRQAIRHIATRQQAIELIHEFAEKAGDPTGAGETRTAQSS